jgi:hypothetical protein
MNYCIKEMMLLDTHSFWTHNINNSLIQVITLLADLGSFKIQFFPSLSLQQAWENAVN